MVMKNESLSKPDMERTQPILPPTNERNKMQSQLRKYNLI